MQIDDYEESAEDLQMKEKLITYVKAKARLIE